MHFATIAQFLSKLCADVGELYSTFLDIEDNIASRLL